MNILITVIVFILIFSVLVLVHEFGHFFAARKSGIKVEEFGFGLPPRIWGFKKSETIYSLNWIPFGGFVRLLGEDARNPRAAKNPCSFIRKPPRVRAAVVLAGVFMNFLLAYALLVVGFVVGIQPLILGGDDILNGISDGTIQTEHGIVIKEVDENGRSAGLQPGDKILEADDRQISSASQLTALLNLPKRQQINLEFLRGQERKTAMLKIGEKPPDFKTYEVLFLPRMGIADVAPTSSFYEAGLRRGDFLLKVNDQNIYTAADWNHILSYANNLSLSVWRENQIKNIQLASLYAERVVISDIFPNTPADKAGFKTGDLIVAINGKSVGTREDVAAITRKFAERELIYVVRRGDNVMEIRVKPADNGMIGVGLSVVLPWQNNQISFYQADLPVSVLKIQDARYPLMVAPVRAFDEIVRLSGLTVVMFGNVVKSLVTRFTVPEGVSGPVGIAQLTYTFVQEGAMPVLRFVAILSLSLGIINVLPFPALDGGRMFFIILEVILGRRINSRWESIIHGIGFVLLMILILAVTYNDVLKFIAP